jgi:hypothetical protein
MDGAVAVHEAEVEKALHDLAWVGMRTLQLPCIARRWHANSICRIEGVEVAHEKQRALPMGAHNVEHDVRLLEACGAAALSDQARWVAKSRTG